MSSAISVQDVALRMVAYPLVNSLNFEQESLQRVQMQLEALQDDTQDTTVRGLAHLYNLPRRSFFTGREYEIKAILNSLDFKSQTFIVAIEGIGGVGMSALISFAGANICNLFSVLSKD